MFSRHMVIVLTILAVSLPATGCIGTAVRPDFGEMDGIAQADPRPTPWSLRARGSASAR